MVVPERDDACVISWNPPTLSLNELAKFTSFLDDLYAQVAAPWVAQELGESSKGSVIPGAPKITRIQMGSPLAIQLIANSGNELSILALGMLGYLLKHPELLGGWMAQIRTARFRHRKEALEAQAALQKCLKELNDKAEIQVHGPPIITFEIKIRRAHASRVIRIPGEPVPEAGLPRAPRAENNVRSPEAETNVWKPIVGNSEKPRGRGVRKGDREHGRE